VCARDFLVGENSFRAAHGATFQENIMTSLARVCGLAILLFVAPSQRLLAQELSGLVGTTGDGAFRNSSYAWQLDYRQYFYRNLGASLSYLNEGHVPGHHRDGNIGEVWVCFPFAKNAFNLSLGAGAYYYYDTQTMANGDSANVHGTAPIYSLGVTGYLSNRWFYRLMLNRVNPTDDIQLNSATVGAGYWFGRGTRPTPGILGDAPDERAYVSDHEWAIYGGQSVVNTLFSQTAHAYAAEYRSGLDRHVDWTASFIYEGDPQIVRRSGIAAQAWVVNTFFNDRYTIGIGVGPYVYIDRKNPRPGNPQNPAAIAPLVGLTFSMKVSDHWLMRFTANRVTTSYNRDADVILLGVGYRWPR
jgi:hypothetical protein